MRFGILGCCSGSTRLFFFLLVFVQGYLSILNVEHDGIFYVIDFLSAGAEEIALANTISIAVLSFLAGRVV